MFVCKWRHFDTATLAAGVGVDLGSTAPPSAFKTSYYDLVEVQQ